MMGRFYITEKLSEHIGETPEGFLIAYDVPVAKIGEQVYKGDEVPIEPNSEGLVTIKRTEEEVFKPEAIQSFEGKPFTIDHPDEMVTPENWKDLAHGFITNLRRGAREKFDLLIGDIVITTNKAIELVKGGMREISCGYDADYEQLDKGVGIQKNIIGNHIALVMRGRAGHRCAIGDKQCTNCGNCNCKNNIEEDGDAMKFKAKLKNVYRRLMRDADFEGLPDEEKADKLAEAAADQVEEEGMLEEQAPVEEPVEEMSEEPMEEPMEEPAPSGGEITNAQLMETLVKLIGIIEAFVKTAAGVGDEETVPKPMPTEEEAKPYVNDDGGGSLPPSGGLPKISGNSPIRIGASQGVASEDVAEKELLVECSNLNCKHRWSISPGNYIVEGNRIVAGPMISCPKCGRMDRPYVVSITNDSIEDPDEKEERERMEAKDCDSRWYDIAYRADLLYPGIRLTKPTRDHRAVVDRIKIKALKNAYTTDSEVVNTIVRNRKVDSLRGEALDVAFMAVSEAIKQKNNRMVKDSVIVQSGKVVSEIQSINQKNKEFWKKK